MAEFSERIKEIENQIERALKTFEMHDELEKALQAYQEAEFRLTTLGIEADHPDYREQQRVLSYCLMRQGNILREMEKPHEASRLGEREITAARLSGDEITLARSLMSNGTNMIVTGELESGLRQIDEARQLYEKGQSYDHRQGLGWYWILQADLANAGMVNRDPHEVVQIATQALTLLEPIENWPGVARAFAARATAYERLGETGHMAEDRQKQRFYDEKET